MPMPLALPLPARVGVAVTFGMATLVASFTVAIVLLDEYGRLEYGNGIRALAVCCAAATAAAGIAGFGPARSHFTGEKRNTVIITAKWAAVLLPLTAELESGVVSGHWWLFVPAQLVVGGLLGLMVAVYRTEWWWLWGLWGAFTTAFGVLWFLVAMVWAR